MSHFSVLVYGATGFTGRLICFALRRAGVAFAIGGRSRDRLSALQREVELPDSAVFCAEISDPRAMAAMAARARVLLSCVGPFAEHGRAVQDVALQVGSHYLDITGEYAYMNATYARDEEARARGVALVSAVGFDVVPSDAAAVLACAELPKVASLRIAFAKSGGASRGTLLSMLQFMHKGMAVIDGALTPEPLAQGRWSPPLPAPFHDWRCVSVPWGDLASAPRSTGVQTVRTYAALPALMIAPLRLVRPLLDTLARPPFSGLVERVVSVLPEGPSLRSLLRSNIAVVAEATDERGERRQAWVRAGDGYLFTAESAALCARLASASAFAGRGALTPTQAFGARGLLDGLLEHGVTWGTGQTSARSAHVDR